MSMYSIIRLIEFHFLVSSWFLLTDHPGNNPSCLFCPRYVRFFNTTFGWTLHSLFQFPVPWSLSRPVQSQARFSVERTFFRRVSFIRFYLLDVKFHM